MKDDCYSILDWDVCGESTLSDPSGHHKCFDQLKIHISLDSHYIFNIKKKLLENY